MSRVKHHDDSRATEDTATILEMKTNELAEQQTELECRKPEGGEQRRLVIAQNVPVSAKSLLGQVHRRCCRCCAFAFPSPSVFLQNAFAFYETHRRTQVTARAVKPRTFRPGIGPLERGLLLLDALLNSAQRCPATTGGEVGRRPGHGSNSVSLYQGVRYGVGDWKHLGGC
jgi:hypothetical protein